MLWTPNDSLYGNYRTNTFQEIWESADAFLDFFNNNGAYVPDISEASARTLYYLLYARYANCPIASSDENRFKFQVLSIIFQYGPTWEKRLEIQTSLRALNLNDIQEGTLAVTNNALNPGNKLTKADELITNVNNQSRTNYKKSKLDAYTQLYAVLETDVTEEFLEKFKKLFIIFAMPSEALWYETEV